MNKILIIDDERPIRSTLKEILEFEKFQVDDAEDGKAGYDLIKKNKYELVFCDIKMPKMDGMEVLEKSISEGIDTPFIMISGHGNVETAVEAIKKGAYDFIQKPLDLNRILVTLRNALDRETIVKENVTLKRKVSKGKVTDIIGESEQIMNIKTMIEKVAPTDARVLITGGNGSGKELVARQLHEKSERSKLPFVEVNCAAIPSELIESELFGHEKGAFTSAHKQRQGKFEQADGGTLFLDEIGDMSLAAQAKVLRALEESKIQRVGSQKDISVDVRVVAATNKDLKKEIENGNFREDLYHRLAVIMIEVPELSKRKSDIPILISHFSKLISKEQGIETKDFNKDSIKLLEDYNWSGNIRELRNVIERLIILGGNPISKEDVNLFTTKK